jgi:UDP-glucose 4-epimerase
VEKPWFVVGGAGFIGTNLAKRRPCTVYDLQHGWDALNYRSLNAAMHGHDTVVHLAANADIAAGADNPELDLEGIDITRNVAKAARHNSVKRIIYTSGSGVYGHRSWGASEETPTVPVSSYGASKLASEAILHAYEQYGIDVTIFRPANVVGPDQTHGVGYDFLRKLREDPTRLEILGDGQQRKQYVHVDDLLDAFDVAPPGTFNVAPKDTLTVDEIAEIACAWLGVQPEITHTGGLAWPGDITRVRMEATYLRRWHWTPRSSRRAMTDALAAL